MNRTALFAHFDPEHRIRPYVVHYLGALRRSCSRVVFVSTAALPDDELAKVQPFCDGVSLKENRGYDFGMWQAVLSDKSVIEQSDEIVFTNSSVFGPIGDLVPVLNRMTEDSADLWGMTESFEHRWHLQSYFLVFKKRAFQSSAFRDFWASVLPYRSKGQIILSYEVGLTTFFVDQGFVARPAFPISAWASSAAALRMCLARRYNPTLFYPEKLLDLGMPLVKVSLLRDNPGDADVARVYQAMARAGYDLDLVSFDRRPKDRRLYSRAKSLVYRLLPELAQGSILTSPVRRQV